MPQPPFTNISITTGTIFRAVLVLIFFALLFYIRDIILVVLTAVVIASAVEPLTVWLGKYKIARLPAVLGTYVLFSAVFIGIFYFFVPSLLSDTSQFLRAVPTILDSVPGSLAVKTDPDTVRQGADLAQSLSRGITEGVAHPSSFSAVFTDLSSVLSSFANGFWDNISAVFGGIVSFILIVVLSFYLAVQEDGIGSFLRVVTPERYESYVLGLWKRAQKKIGLWIQGQILLAVLVGFLVYLSLTILGVKNAIFLAVLAALFETIPLFGPIISAIPGIALAYAAGTFFTAPGLTSALCIAGVYLIIQQFENHLFYPLVVKKIVGVPPMLVILALIIGAELAGFLGLLLSVPLAATLMEFFGDMEKRKQPAA